MCTHSYIIRLYSDDGIFEHQFDIRAISVENSPMLKMFNVYVRLMTYFNLKKSDTENEDP